MIRINCPLPRYYFCHAVVALAIALALWWPLGLPAGCAAGVAFYAGREFTQWDQGDGPGLPFDWKGVLVPLVVCACLLAAYRLLGGYV
jgi:hypothetical protein